MAKYDDLVKEIKLRFDRALKLNPKSTKVRATDFKDLYDDFGPNLLTQVRKDMGIKSVSKFVKTDITKELMAQGKTLTSREYDTERRYYWKFPTNYPIKTPRDPNNRQSVRDLRKVMGYCGYFGLGTEIIQEMEEGGVARITTILAKKVLGIKSKRIDGRGYWLYAPKPVQNWLTEYLSEGPRSVDSIYKDSHFHKEVIKEARKQLTISIKTHKGVEYWSDINSVYTPRDYDLQATVDSINNSGYLQVVGIDEDGIPKIIGRK